MDRIFEKGLIARGAWQKVCFGACAQGDYQCGVPVEAVLDSRVAPPANAVLRSMVPKNGSKSTSRMCPRPVQREFMNKALLRTGRGKRCAVEHMLKVTISAIGRHANLTLLY